MILFIQKITFHHSKSLQSSVIFFSQPVISLNSSKSKSGVSSVITRSFFVANIDLAIVSLSSMLVLIVLQETYHSVSVSMALFP